MYLYDNLLKSNLADMTIVIKSVLQIKVNDKEALTTTQIWKDIESLVKEKEVDDGKPHKYNMKGYEFTFNLNLFADMQEIIRQHNEERKQEGDS